MKILITGVSGFIGKNTARYFLDKGNDVVGVDLVQDNDLLFTKGFQHIHADLSVSGFSKDFPPVDAVIHLAAYMNPEADYGEELSYLQRSFFTNEVATLEMLQWIRSKESKRPVMIFASTSKTVERKLTPYGVAKRGAESWCLLHMEQCHLPVVIFRQGAVYGPYQKNKRTRGWINWFMEKNIQHQQIDITGDGDQVRDVLYVGDLVRAYEVAIKRKEMWGKLFPIGGGKENAITINQAVSFIEELSGVDFPVIKYSGDDRSIYVSDLSDILSFWQPETSWKSGFTKTFSWVKENL